MSDHYEPAAFKARVDDVLTCFIAQEAELLLAVDADLAPVADQLEASVAHGKRLRAAFCYWGWRAAGQPDSEALVRAAASMELVHAAAVVHDDIIDDSPVRHGLPTAHMALRGSVRQGHRVKAAARGLAMMVGDLLMSLAGQLFTVSGLPAAYLSRARPLWATLARELIAGECLEILRTGAGPDTAGSLKVIRYKTAKYTVEHPLHIGGALGGADPRLREAFSCYGLPLGEAFQLRDDLLGLFGDPARTGKANLDDIRTRRPTALLAETWKAADDADRGRLKALLGRRHLDEQDLETVRAIMTRAKSPARVERMIDARVAEAMAALGDADMPTHAVRALTDLANGAAVRHR
ncbi:polyprenyl synthetase family protein [Streptomyces sp. NPDC051907]|uniref:polyprenyl synthetase family protein n=1 Tax=Streptomyces sp. NPDC051907 TaxID=3155284 RepID=UPI0034281B50